jgi:DNA-3-methyladenine glycosylase I
MAGHGRSWRSLRQIPATTAESDAFSRDLKRRGFDVGSTVIYALKRSAWSTIT